MKLKTQIVLFVLYVLSVTGCFLADIWIAPGAGLGDAGSLILVISDFILMFAAGIKIPEEQRNDRTEFLTLINDLCELERWIAVCLILYFQDWYISIEGNVPTYMKMYDQALYLLVMGGYLIMGIVSLLIKNKGIPYVLQKQEKENEQKAIEA